MIGHYFQKSLSMVDVIISSVLPASKAQHRSAIFMQLESHGGMEVGKKQWVFQYREAVVPSVSAALKVHSRTEIWPLRS